MFAYVRLRGVRHNGNVVDRDRPQWEVFGDARAELGEWLRRAQLVFPL